MDKTGKIGFEFRPCRCGIGGGPHHHVDSYTVIPWDEFCRSMKAYEAQQGEADGQDEDRVDGADLEPGPRL